VVSQEFSWGSFCVIVDTFLGLIQAEQVFDPFLDRLGSFGQKIREKETKWRGFWGSITRGAAACCYPHPLVGTIVAKYQQQPNCVIISITWKETDGCAAILGLYGRLVSIIGQDCKMTALAISCCSQSSILVGSSMLPYVVQTVTPTV